MLQQHGCQGKDGTGIEVLEKLVEFGYDYIELPLAQMMELSDEEFEELKQKLNVLALIVRACNNFFPVYMRLTGPETDKAAIEKYYKKH